MHVRRRKDGQSPWVRLQLHKGVILVLTLEEYAIALSRGKMERRAQRRALHAQQAQARRDRTVLAWIEKEGHYGSRDDRTAKRSAADPDASTDP
jgi:hypothetical protein